MSAMDSPFRIAIVGGTGVGEALADQLDTKGRCSERPETPFGLPSDEIQLGSIEGTPVALLRRHGAQHQFNPTHVPYRANIFALKLLGCTHVLASGATGSLQEAIKPRDLVLCDQLIDRTTARDQQRTFFDGAAVHVEFADPCCAVMRQWLMQAAESCDDLILHPQGTYVCMEGPAFSTRAESRMHRSWGGDLIGMTALPEARLVREAEMAYALVGMPTDYDAWREHDPGEDTATVLTEVLAHLAHASDACLKLIRAALRDVTVLRDTPSEAGSALANAIWTSPDAIDHETRQKLAPLWSQRLGV